MATQKRLSVVTPETKAARRKPATVLAAATAEKPRDLLVALRTRIARDIDNPNTPARDLAALSRRLLEITREIEVLDKDNPGGDPLGDAARTPDESVDAEAL